MAVQIESSISGHEGKRQILEWGVVGLAGFYILVRTLQLIGHASPFITDDAFITLRYAQNLIDGYGLRFNPGGERVEGYSNFSFVLLAAAAKSISVDPIAVIRLVSGLALAGTSVLTFLVARRWVGPITALIPAYVLTAYHGTILWTVSGLETAFYQFLTVGVVWAGIRILEAVEEMGDEELRSSKFLGRCLVFSLFALAAALTRPEGPIIGLIIIAIISARVIMGGEAQDGEDSLARPPLFIRGGLLISGLFLLPYTLYFIARWIYFGDIFPHSVSCKAFHDGSPWTLLNGFWEMAKIYILLALAVPWRRMDLRYGLVLAVPVGYALILFGADPIVGYGNRHFLAAFALVLIGSAVGLSSVVEIAAASLKGSVRQLIALMAAVILVGLPAGTAHHLESWSGQYRDRMEGRADLAEWLAKELDSGDRYLIGDAGLIPYRTGAKAVDAFCLNNPDATRAEVGRDTERLVDWTLEDPPEFIVVHSFRPDRLAPRPEYDFYPTLVQRDDFQAQYELSVRMGAPGDDFHYWVFKRHSR